jgi:hypothetical protein
MSDDKKLYSAREAALAVLSKAKSVLGESNLTKSEYKTENSPKAGVKYGKIEKDQKALERDYNEYEVRPGKSLDSKGPRLARQVSPSGNPREEAEGNNQSDGMEPPYEFKNKVSKELAKEKASHGMDKAENPDKEQDAKLGEKVEHDVEEHMMENADAERQEGHKVMDKPEYKKSEGMEGEKSFVPARLIASAKLSKFMEYRHAKKKAQMAQEAAGSQAPDAPPARSTQSGQPDPKKV